MTTRPKLSELPAKIAMVECAKEFPIPRRPHQGVEVCEICSSVHHSRVEHLTCIANTMHGARRDHGEPPIEYTHSRVSSTASYKSNSSTSSAGSIVADRIQYFNSLSHSCSDKTSKEVEEAPASSPFDSEILDPLTGNVYQTVEEYMNDLHKQDEMAMNARRPTLASRSVNGYARELLSWMNGSRGISSGHQENPLDKSEVPHQRASSRASVESASARKPLPKPVRQTTSGLFKFPTLSHSQVCSSNSSPPSSSTPDTSGSTPARKPRPAGLKKPHQPVSNTPDAPTELVSESSGFCNYEWDHLNKLPFSIGSSRHHAPSVASEASYWCPRCFSIDPDHSDPNLSLSELKQYRDIHLHGINQRVEHWLQDASFKETPEVWTRVRRASSKDIALKPRPKTSLRRKGDTFERPRAAPIPPGKEVKRKFQFLGSGAFQQPRPAPAPPVAQRKVAKGRRSSRTSSHRKPGAAHAALTKLSSGAPSVASKLGSTSKHVSGHSRFPSQALNPYGGRAHERAPAPPMTNAQWMLAAFGTQDFEKLMNPRKAPRRPSTKKSGSKEPAKSAFSDFSSAPPTPAMQLLSSQSKAANTRASIPRKPLPHGIHKPNTPQKSAFSDFSSIVSSPSLRRSLPRPTPSPLSPLTRSPRLSTFNPSPIINDSQISCTPHGLSSMSSISPNINESQTPSTPHRLASMSSVDTMTNLVDDLSRYLDNEIHAKGRPLRDVLAEWESLSDEIEQKTGLKNYWWAILQALDDEVIHELEEGLL